MNAESSNPTDAAFSDNPYVLVAYAEASKLVGPFVENQNGKLVLTDGWQQPLEDYLNRCEALSADCGLVALAGLGKFAHALLEMLEDPNVAPPLDPISTRRFVHHCRGFMPRITALGHKTGGSAHIRDPNVFARFRAEASTDVRGMQKGQEEKAARRGIPPHLALRLDRVSQLREMDAKKKK